MILRASRVARSCCLLLVFCCDIFVAHDYGDDYDNISDNDIDYNHTTLETKTATTNAFGLPMDGCPPPLDPSLLYLPHSHVRNLVGQYHNYFEYYCNGCRTCILETYNRYVEYFMINGEGTCWGYETKPLCAVNRRFLPPPNCSMDSTQSKFDSDRKSQIFYVQADFGYIREQRKQLKVICNPTSADEGFLECTNNAQFCRGRNIMIQFKHLQQRKTPIRYHTDVLQRGHIGAQCLLNQTALRGLMEFMSPLQSWAPELRNIVQLTDNPIQSKQCDEVIERPTFIMKVDATNNIYHHFCDFFNLYAAQHVNNSDPTAFSTDVNILIWETYPYKTPFAAAFNAFTHHPIMTLSDVAGRNICFRKLVLPLLPRMIFGMYYNTPLEPGCSNSGLFNAFSDHMLHRLRIPLHAKPRPFGIRVTFMERNTLYRKVMNSNDLVLKLSDDDIFIVEQVQFEKMSFTDQLETIRNTDILVGMHGAGLTHLLFLPKWATVFELYNCGDAGCYRDLARLRGVDYITWERPDKMMKGLGPSRDDSVEQEKFTNYSFDPDEFLRMMYKALENLERNPDFLNYIGATPSTVSFDEKMFGDRSKTDHARKMRKRSQTEEL